MGADVMPPDIYDQIPLASVTHASLKLSSDFKDMKLKLEDLTSQMEKLETARLRHEGSRAWEEGHALLCKRKGCAHRNPYK